MSSELITERLRLRPLRADDAASLHDAYNDPAALRFWHRLPTETRERSAAVLAEYAASGIWAICHAGSDEAIGHIGFALGAVIPPGAASFGYFLRPDAWGHGYATEAGRAALDHGFGTRGVAAAELWIYDGNAASRRVAEKLGGVHRGSFWGNNLELRAARHIHVYEIAGATPLPHSEIHRVIPVLRVPDVAAALAWWRDTLGFRLEWALDDPPVSASMVAPGWLPNAAVVRFRLGAVQPMHLVFVVPIGLDALAASVGQPVIDQPWGMRELGLVDPFGNTLVFECAG